MPLYDYECLQCKQDFEVICPVAHRRYVGCPVDSSHFVQQVIKRGHGGVQIFDRGVWRDIDFDPIDIQSPQQLRKELEARGSRAEYLDNGLWKTSPEATSVELAWEAKKNARR